MGGRGGGGGGRVGVGQVCSAVRHDLIQQTSKVYMWWSLTIVIAAHL